MPPFLPFKINTTGEWYNIYKILVRENSKYLKISSFFSSNLRLNSEYFNYFHYGNKMAEKKGTKAISGWKKKKWFTVVGPDFMKQVPIGETPANDASYLVGRTIKISLMAITNDPKHQNFSIDFEIDKVAGLNAHTRIKAFHMSGSAIKRFVKRGRDRIDDSFVANTKDNIQIRIKPLLITRENSKGSILTKLRKYTRELIIKQVKTLTYDQLMQDIIYGKFTKQIKPSLNKIYPLKSVDVRSIEVLDFSGKISVVEETSPVEKKSETKKTETKPEQATISET